MKYKDKVKVVGGFYDGIRGEVRVENNSIDSYTILTDAKELIIVETKFIQLEDQDAENHEVQKHGWY